MGVDDTFTVAYKDMPNDAMRRPASRARKVAETTLVVPLLESTNADIYVGLGGGVFEDPSRERVFLGYRFFGGKGVGDIFFPNAMRPGAEAVEQKSKKSKKSKKRTGCGGLCRHRRTIASIRKRFLLQVWPVKKLIGSGASTKRFVCRIEEDGGDRVMQRRRWKTAPSSPPPC